MVHFILKVLKHRLCFVMKPAPLAFPFGHLVPSLMMGTLKDERYFFLVRTNDIFASWLKLSFSFCSVAFICYWLVNQASRTESVQVFLRLLGLFNLPAVATACHR